MLAYYFKVVATDGGQIPEAGQWPETTVHMPTGSTRTVELVANAPGDWVMHCHMLHHVMTQMGHTFGNFIGIKPDGLNEKIRKLVPGYLTMGQDGMADMGEMGIHQWWPATAKQTRLLTVDDPSRKLLGAVFVPTDTTWNHFEHFRRLLLQHALPLVVYTDGLSLFGHDSMADDRDPGSEFQRAFSALGVTHLVAPSPQDRTPLWHPATAPGGAPGL